MAEVILDTVIKEYDQTRAVDSVSLSVRDGELLSLLGPSGCGKTTLLRLIAGFERVDQGRITIGPAVVSAPDAYVAAENRNVGVVFQTYALWPHMTVAGNVGYPLKVAGIRGSERTRRVNEALETVGLSGMGDRRPADLSGGQRQRVALARCLVMRPEVVLLDEPLANLDVHLREAMLQEFQEFHAKTRATMIFVTHDQSEAMAISDRIAVMGGGKLLQVATPQELYECPINREVARFVGKGSVIPVNITQVMDRTCHAVMWGFETILRCRPGQPTGQALACFKSSDVKNGERGLLCSIMSRVYRGGATLFEVMPIANRNGADPLRLTIQGHTALNIGEQVSVDIHNGWILPAG